MRQEAPDTISWCSICHPWYPGTHLPQPPSRDSNRASGGQLISTIGVPSEVSPSRLAGESPLDQHQRLRDMPGTRLVGLAGQRL